MAFFANSVKKHRTYQGLLSLFTDMYMYIGLLQITSGTFFKLCLFVLWFSVPVYSYGHVKTAIFTGLGKLRQSENHFFLDMLLL